MFRNQLNLKMSQEATDEIVAILLLHTKMNLDEYNKKYIYNLAAYFTEYSKPGVLKYSG